MGICGVFFDPVNKISNLFCFVLFCNTILPKSKWVHKGFLLRNISCDNTKIFCENLGNIQPS